MPEKMVNSKENVIPFANLGKIEESSASERLTEFIQNNRKVILMIIVAIVVVLGVSIIGLSIRDALRKNAIAQVEEFNRRLMILNPNLNWENLSEDGFAVSDSPEMNTLIAELSTFAGRTSGYAGARAYHILGNIYAEKRDWEAAEKAFTAGAKAGARTYLEAVSLFNAASCADELGNTQGAIDLYKRSVALKNIFPAAVRAQFQIGRLEESRNNRDAALQAYRDVINNWSENSGWTNLAHSRIIALTLPNR